VECRGCGAMLAEDARFCPSCGRPAARTVRDPAGAVTPVPPVVAAAPATVVPMGGQPGVVIAGFVLAIIGLFVPVLGPIGLILSAVGYKQAKQIGASAALAVTGIILGAISMVVSTFIALTVLMAFTSNAGL